MLMIWRGYGWATLIVFGVAWIAGVIAMKGIIDIDYYKANDWPQNVALIGASILTGLFGYYLNYKRRSIHIDNETGVKTKSPSHTMFFIPVQYWGIIIPLVFSWAHMKSEETDAKELALLEAPLSGDRYLVDYSKLLNDYDNKYKYAALKVSTVSATSVVVLYSKQASTKKSGVRMALNDGSMDKADYFDGSKEYTISELIHFKETNAIFKVDRSL